MIIQKLEPLVRIIFQEYHDENCGNYRYSQNFELSE